MNSFEASIVKSLQASGYVVFSSGWPDLLVFDGKGKSIALEIKSMPDKVRVSQEKMFLALQRLGLAVVVVNSSMDAMLACRRAGLLVDSTLSVVKEKSKKGSPGKRVWAYYQDGAIHIPIEEDLIRRAAARLLVGKHQGRAPMRTLAKLMRQPVLDLVSYGRRGRPGAEGLAVRREAARVLLRPTLVFRAVK